VSARFPKLAPSSFSVSSPVDFGYNCVAWALERDQARWWQPGGPPYFWPISAAPPTLSIDAYIAAFHAVGYRSCHSRSYLRGWDKIAIYTDGLATFLHVAAQLPDKTWTSKLGQGQDINHRMLESLEGGLYGHVTHTMRRLNADIRGVRRLLAIIAGLVSR
jgi:hypothetical protein